MAATGYTSNPPSGGGEGGPVAWADITGKPTTFTPAAHTQAASTISDSTTVGRSVLTAADAAAARTAIGAGTSSLALGSTSSTAAAGNHGHAIADVSGLQAALDAKATAASVTALDTATAASVTALDGRLDTLEAVGPVVMSWNGSAYVQDTDARIYVGPGDPGAVPDGSVWIDTTP